MGPPQRRPMNTGQPFPRPSQRSTTDAYFMLQNMSLPTKKKPSQTSESSKRHNEDGKERRLRIERGERPERNAQGGPRGDNRRGDRQPRKNDREGGARAETSRAGNKERVPRRDVENSAPSPLRHQDPKPEIVQRAAPTVEELFGDSSMFGQQGSVVNDVFESLQGAEEAQSSKSTCAVFDISLLALNFPPPDVPKVTNLDLLPPSPIVPHSVTPAAPRKQIHDFAVLQADYALSRNSNVTLDQRGQAIGVVKQRLGA